MLLSIPLLILAVAAYHVVALFAGLPVEPALGLLPVPALLSVVLCPSLSRECSDERECESAI